MVAQWLVYWPLMVEVQRSVLVEGEKFAGSKFAPLTSLAGMMLIQCTVLQIGMLTGGSICRESHLHLKCHIKL